MNWREMSERLTPLIKKMGLVGMSSPYTGHAGEAEELLHELSHAILLGKDMGRKASDEVSDCIAHMRTRYADEHEARTCALEIAIARKLGKKISPQTMAGYALSGMQGFYRTANAVKTDIEKYLKHDGLDVLATRGVKIVMAS